MSRLLCEEGLLFSLARHFTYNEMHPGFPDMTKAYST